MTSSEIVTSQENLYFYEQIMDNVPALVYINEFTEQGNPHSLVNVWSNRFAEKFIGYSHEESRAMGFSFFEKILHPDDLEIIKTTANMNSNPQIALTFLQRLKPKDKNEYIWMYGSGVLLEQYDNGDPKKSLSIVLEISTKMSTDNQLVAALKEINRLKHKLHCHSLTKREKEVLHCIAEGYTDVEIGKKLFISFATAKTHRNKIITKLGLKNSASLAAFAVECGMN